MSYSIEPHPDELIVIGVAGVDFSVGKEQEQYFQELHTVLDQMPAPIVYIADVRGMSMNFGDITGSMGALTRGDMAVFKHHNLHSVIVVTESSLISMGVKALGQAQYGSLKAMVTGSIEEAREMARNELAQKA